MGGICDITVRSGETYVHDLAPQRHPKSCKADRSILHYFSM